MSCRILHYPSKKYALMLRVCLGFCAAVFLGAAAAIYFLFWAPAAALCCAIGAMLVFAAVFLPDMICKSQSYLRTRSKLIINSGILQKRTVIIERVQMQCVTLKRSPLERIFGLCSVVFCCSGARYTLGGLSVEDAARLRKLFEGEGYR